MKGKILIQFEIEPEPTEWYGGQVHLSSSVIEVVVFLCRCAQTRDLATTFKSTALWLSFPSGPVL